MSFDKDINKTIASAVNAKIEGAVLEALTTDSVMATYVTAALQEPQRDRYGSRSRETYLGAVIKEAVKKQAQGVVSEEIQKQEDVIRDEVRKALSKSLGIITDSLVSGFVENTKGNYPSIKVEFGER